MNLTKEQAWEVQDKEYQLFEDLCFPVVYKAPELTPREILDTFMPDCLPVIKKNITLLKKKRKEVEPELSKLLDQVYDRVYTLELSESYREVFLQVNKWFFYDRIIKEIDDKIKELEQLLKMTQIQSIGKPDAHLDLERAKQYPLKNFVQINHSGFAKCPFHNEKTASMKIYKDNRFHCFGCGKDGDVIDFVMQRDGVDFKTAVTLLNQ